MPELPHKKRRSRHKREQSSKSLQLTERDLDILETLFLRRAATTQQLAQLVMGRAENTHFHARLAEFFHRGLLTRRFFITPYGIAPSKILHMIDRKGIHLLETYRGLKGKWSTDTLRVQQHFLAHTLAINDLEIAIRAGTQKLGLPLTDWIGESAIKADYDRITVPGLKGDGKPKAVQPDVAFALYIPLPHQNVKKWFLVEVDKGTEVRKQFGAKIPTYIAYFRSSQCKRRYGTPLLRVLVVTTSDRRLANLKRYTEAAGGKQRFWFTTLTALHQANALSDPIWQLAGQDGQVALVSGENVESSLIKNGVAAFLATPFLLKSPLNSIPTLLTSEPGGALRLGQATSQHR